VVLPNSTETTVASAWLTGLAGDLLISKLPEVPPIMWKTLLPYATSYDEFINPDEDTRLEALLSDPDPLRQEQSVIRKETVDILKKALKDLPSRERYILERRFGIVDDVEMTLGAIARILKLSKERVRQLERDALVKLRATLSAMRQDLQII